jgi:hypothetical protein
MEMVLEQRAPPKQLEAPIDAEFEVVGSTQGLEDLLR